MSPERENTETEKIIGKEAVIFDVDNTILDTHPVYQEAYVNLRNILISEYGDVIANSLCDEFLFDTYNPEGKYKGIIDINFLANEFSKSLIERELLEDTSKAIEAIKKPLRDIYKTVPEFLPGAEDLLKHLIADNKRIAFCTHSGDWGKLKVDYIWEEISLPGEDPVYYSVPLDEEKDGSSYLKVVNMLGLRPSEVVVIGDNMKADINAALDIGVDTCVFYQYKVPGETEFRNNEEVVVAPDCVVYKKDSLEEIKKLF